MKTGQIFLAPTILCFRLLVACTEVNYPKLTATDAIIDMIKLNPLAPNSIVAPQEKNAFSAQVEYENHEIFVVSAGDSNFVRLTNMVSKMTLLGHQMAQKSILFLLALA